MTEKPSKIATLLQSTPLGYHKMLCISQVDCFETASLTLQESVFIAVVWVQNSLFSLYKKCIRKLDSLVQETANCLTWEQSSVV